MKLAKRGTGKSWENMHFKWSPKPYKSNRIQRLFRKN